jgi:hypothetical protein
MYGSCRPASRRSPCNPFIILEFVVYGIPRGCDDPVAGALAGPGLAAGVGGQPQGEKATIAKTAGHDRAVALSAGERRIGVGRFQAGSAASSAATRPATPFVNRLSRPEFRRLWSASRPQRVLPGSGSDRRGHSEDDRGRFAGLT